jgi:hypothetical protein
MRNKENKQERQKDNTNKVREKTSINKYIQINNHNRRKQGNK